jgi:hypothetical protein
LEERRFANKIQGRRIFVLVAQKQGFLDADGNPTPMAIESRQKHLSELERKSIGKGR